MKLIKISLKPVDLLDKITKLESLVVSCHSDSLLEYPNANYQTLDQLVVEYAKAVCTLKNVYNQWAIDSGYLAGKNNIEYFDRRIKQLQNFYLQAGAQDGKDLIFTLSVLQEKMLNQVRLVNLLEKQEFQVELSEELVLLINKI